MIPLPPLLEAFFTERLMQQRHASANTVAAYRDTFRLLLAFMQSRTRTAPSDLELEDVNARRVAAFLEHLEVDRGNSVTSRNARLSAIHSFFNYIATREPAAAALCQQVLAIPQKRRGRATVSFLSPEETEALLDAPDRSSWLGRRDHALLLVAVQLGLRVSELVNLRTTDLHLGAGPHVRCTGKGRKERCTPLMPSTVSTLREWLRALGPGASGPLFPSIRGGFLSRDAVERLLAKHVAVAAQQQPTLHGKNVSPHVLRHTSAMRLLRAGVDTSVIALWLGHESVETTQIYLHADLGLKERALSKTAPLGNGTRRFKADDRLLAFLEGL